MKKRVTSNQDFNPEDYEGGYTEWEKLSTKSVEDSDGFMTEYSLWYNEFTEMYVCIFGDTDIYYPENADYDFETDSEEEAWEWFNSYTGFSDVEESVQASEDMDEPKTASWIVRRMYNKFPECEFLDERDMGDNVALFFKLGGDTGKLQDWLDQIKSGYGIDCRISNGKLRIVVPEDDVEEGQNLSTNSSEIVSAEDIDENDMKYYLDKIEGKISEAIEVVNDVKDVWPNRGSEWVKLTKCVDCLNKAIKEISKGTYV